MEDKIKEFRRRKRSEEFWKALSFRSVMEKLRTNSPVPEIISVEPVDVAGSRPVSPPPAYDSVVNEDNISIASSNVSFSWSPSVSTVSRLQLVTYLLYTVLWLTVFLIAIESGFGSAFFLVSAILAIYLNTRTGPKKEGEVSAYSVFNTNCEAIDGTLKAEQFEREFNLIKH